MTKGEIMSQSPEDREWIAYRQRKPPAKDNSKPGDFIGKPTDEEWAAHCKKQLEKTHRYFAKLQEQSRLEKAKSITPDTEDLA